MPEKSRQRNARTKSSAATSLQEKINSSLSFWEFHLFSSNIQVTISSSIAKLPCCGTVGTTENAVSMLVKKITYTSLSARCLDVLQRFFPELKLVDSYF